MGHKKQVSKKALLDIYHKLFEEYGARHWWPGETQFEVVIGAILTQNTAWKNVERAIEQLKSRQLLSPERLREISTEELALLIRSSGYFNQKAKKIKEFLSYFHKYGFRFANMEAVPTIQLRNELLEIKGIGPETADSILLYALGKSTFVIDAYTKRIFSRLGFIEETMSYDRVQQLFMHYLPNDIALFNEYHALIVCFAHNQCKKKPECKTCFLRKQCVYYASVIFNPVL